MEIQTNLSFYPRDIPRSMPKSGASDTNAEAEILGRWGFGAGDIWARLDAMSSFDASWSNSSTGRSSERRFKVSPCKVRALLR